MKSGCYPVLAALACVPALADDLPGLYKPAENLWLNDPRVFVVDGTYHLYFQRPPRELGHAVSHDLISWRRMPGGISRGPKGAWDDRDLCTSDVFYWQGTFYALYTARSDRDGENARVQRIGLATSKDGERFDRHPGNPVLPADPRWYETDYRNAPGYGNVAWRDPAIWRNPSDGLFYAYITGRVNKGPGNKRGCIALARSKDLVDWECFPPCYWPKLETYHEVPQMIQWDDDTYVLFYGRKTGRFTQMWYVFGSAPLRFDDNDPGKLFLGANVNSSGRGMEYSSWVVPRAGGFDVVHLVYEWENGKLVRGRLSLPKRLKGTPQTGLYMELRDDLRTGPQDAINLSKLEPGPGWQVSKDRIVAAPNEKMNVLPLPGTGPRTVSMRIAVGKDAAPALRILLNGDGQITTWIEGLKTKQRWTVGRPAGTLSLTVTGKHVGIYFDNRYVGTACAATGPASDCLSLVALGPSACTFTALAQRAIPMSHSCPE